MMWYPSDAPSSRSLLLASSENVRSAINWLRTIYADGGTDILTPYRAASEILDSTSLSTPTLQSRDSRLPPGFIPAGKVGHSRVSSEERELSPRAIVVESNENRIKTIVLITDGAVENEVDICRYASQYWKMNASNDRAIRTFTFG